MRLNITPVLFIELEKEAKDLGISIQKLIQHKLFEHYELIKKQPITTEHCHRVHTSDKSNNTRKECQGKPTQKS